MSSKNILSVSQNDHRKWWQSLYIVQAAAHSCEFKFLLQGGKKKRLAKEITIPSSSMNPAEGMSVLVSASIQLCWSGWDVQGKSWGHCPGLAHICGQVFHLLCKSVVMDGPIFQAFLEMGQRLWGSLGVSILLHGHLLASFLHLCSAVLCCSPGSIRVWISFQGWCFKNQVLFGHPLIPGTVTLRSSRAFLSSWWGGGGDAAPQSTLCLQSTSLGLYKPISQHQPVIK